jgi:hypothetical protein
MQYPSMQMSFLKAIAKVTVRTNHGHLSKVCTTLPMPWLSLPILSRMWAACPGGSKEESTNSRASKEATNSHHSNLKLSTLSQMPPKASGSLQPQPKLLLALHPNP